MGGKKHLIEKKHRVLLLTQNLRMHAHYRSFQKNDMNVTVMAAHYEKLWNDKLWCTCFLGANYYPASKQKVVPFLNLFWKVFLQRRTKAFFVDNPIAFPYVWNPLSLALSSVTTETTSYPSPVSSAHTI